MSRTAKGPRLYLRRGRTDPRTGQPLADVWFIRDGQSQRSTGCRVDQLGEAEKRLAEYIASKWTPPKADSRGDPTQVLVAEVIALYAAERVPHLKSDPKSTAGFIKNLLDWWGERAVSDVKRSTCQAYVAYRTKQVNSRATKGGGGLVSPQTARRELEVLSAAIGYWHGEDSLTTRPKVWLPEKAESPRDALTREQAARLLKAAMGYRRTEKQDGRVTWKRLSGSARKNRAHLRRFLMIGLYTGTRHTAINKLLWSESPN
jgi:hypothetical protein